MAQHEPCYQLFMQYLCKLHMKIVNGVDRCVCIYILFCPEDSIIARSPNHNSSGNKNFLERGVVVT